MASSCIAEPPVAGAAGANDLELVVRDARGDVADGMAMPRRPQLWLTARPPFTLQSTSALLFHGGADAALRDDLDRLPLTSASEQRLVASD
ncbi:MAG TPA: hypothetical protein VHZ95_18200, partial [Polyangiales bacterium]|nr:hypothetical protein [Polyangiales bacterium]